MNGRWFRTLYRCNSDQRTKEGRKQRYKGSCISLRVHNIRKEPIILIFANAPWRKASHMREMKQALIIVRSGMVKANPSPQRAWKRLVAYVLP